MLGDTYKALKQFDKAKDAYNQGYMEALQIENKMRSAQIKCDYEAEIGRSAGISK